LLTGRLGYTSAFKAWTRRFEAEDIEHAYALLDTVGLAGFADQRADALSGGQQVFHDGQAFDQVVFLEHHADAPACAAQRCAAHPGQIDGAV
ncbi:hypothetical protein, partial [Xylella fastidiosa]|uniref:hypothetical protein n=1 Tax=Xylella fastidiosa TaxID=2371 RepID=UPI003CCF8922